MPASNAASQNDRFAFGQSGRRMRDLGLAVQRQTFSSVVAGLLFVLLLNSAFGQDAIRKESSWSPAGTERLNSEFEKWILESRIGKKPARAIRDYLRSGGDDSVSRLDRVIEGIGMGDTDVARFASSLKSATGDAHTSASGLLENEARHSFVRNHVRLFYGRWLARNRLFDESLEQLKKMDVDAVLDPATLLYYRGLMQHQLLQPKECIKTLKRLLENEDALPRRYAVLAKLMLTDMQRLEKDSLDEISRMMSDIGRRAELNRIGTRVRKKEQAVVAKLDKLIERLEEQQCQPQAGQGNARSSSPAVREQRLAGRGTGDVRSRRQTDGGQWGNLDPAQRDAAMAEMSKDLPPHYRSVIEEYFRKLADRTEKQP